MRKQQESKGGGKREEVCREADTRGGVGNTGDKKREVEGRKLEGEQRRGRGRKENKEK